MKNNKYEGYCVICGCYCCFQSKSSSTSFRENYPCPSCKSTLRFRGQAESILKIYKKESMKNLTELAEDPSFSQLNIYEPGVSGPFRKLFSKYENYIHSFYWDDVELGNSKDGIQCQSLEELTFNDNQFDLIISSDIMEHVRHPWIAFKEIYRVLKPNGYHVFSIPIHLPMPTYTKYRVDTSTDKNIHLEEPHYHGDGTGGKSLVYTDYGADIVDHLVKIGYRVTLDTIKSNHMDVKKLITFVTQKSVPEKANIQFKSIEYNEFQIVKNLLDTSKSNSSHNLAMQVQETSKEISHSRPFRTPFDWHAVQIDNLEQQPDRGKKFAAKHTTRELSVSYIKNAKLLNGVIFNSDLAFHRDTYYHRFRTKVDFNRCLLSPITTIKEPVFYLGKTKMHSHWLLDCLSALHLWKELGLVQEARLFVADYNNLKKQTLEAYGIESDKIITNSSEHISFNHIYIPSTLGGGQAWGPPSFLPSFHRESVSSIIPSTKKTRYYVSRLKKAKRSITNEVEVERMLKRMGFTVLFIEDYPFDKQVKIMKSASIIVAPHGTGLTNIIYTQPKTIIVELLCEYYLNCCFYKLSAISNLKYTTLVSDDYEVKGSTKDDHVWTVDLKKLELLLSHILDNGQ